MGKSRFVKCIYVFNGILIKDSLLSNVLLNESKNYKTKIKRNPMKDSIAVRLNLDIKNSAYYFEFIEIKDVIIDPETMRLIKIK